MVNTSLINLLLQMTTLYQHKLLFRNKNICYLVNFRLWAYLVILKKKSYCIFTPTEWMYVVDQHKLTYPLSFKLFAIFITFYGLTWVVKMINRIITMLSNWATQVINYSSSLKLWMVPYASSILLCNDLLPRWKSPEWLWR